MVVVHVPVDVPRSLASRVSDTEAKNSEKLILQQGAEAEDSRIVLAVLL